MQFSLSKLFLVVTVAAIACELVVYSSRKGTDVIVIPTALLFAAALVWSIALRGKLRAIAITFALVGGGYLLVVATDICEPVRDSMPTHYLLALPVKVLVHPTYGPDKSTRVPLPETFWMIYSNNPWDAYRFRTFYVIGHCVFALLLGLLAAWFASAMYTKGQREPGAMTMRFTRTKALAAVALFSLAMAGMIFPYWQCGQAVGTLTVALFVVTAIASLAMRGRDRAFAIAFSAVGALYLAEITLGISRPIFHHMPTNNLVALAWNYLPVPDWAIPHSRYDGKPFLNAYGDFYITLWNGDGTFFFIGHCIFSWVFALVAGWSAAAMYAKREKLRKA